MTDTIELLQTRRSVPPLGMSGPGPTPEQLDALLRTAARVPDHGKLVPWRFVVFEGEGRNRAGDVIANVYLLDNPGAVTKRAEFERKRLAHAPTVVAVVSRAAPHEKIPEWEQVLSAGAVCMNLTVAANALGFATTWITEWYAYDRRVLDAFGLAPHEKIAGFLHIGRHEGRPEDRVRPVMEEIVSRY